MSTHREINDMPAAVTYKGRPRSLRSYAINGMLRCLVRPRIKPRLDIHRLRRFLHHYLDARPQRRTGVVQRQSLLAGREIHAFRPPRARPRELILYLHGGGFCMESPRMHGAFVERLALAARACAVMPAYRLAPEHRFPAAVEDVLDVYTALLERGQDPSRLVVAGDSAGGNLTLVLLQQLRERGLPMPAAAVMISPALDLDGTSSHRENRRRDPLINHHAWPLMIEWYLGGKRELLRDPRASPLGGDFSGLPPLMLVAGSTEILRDDALVAASFAHEAGVAVVCDIWHGMPHCFPLLFPTLLPEARTAIADIGAFINQTLGESKKQGRPPQ